jgi:hypothetical protein
MIKFEYDELAKFAEDNLEEPVLSRFVALLKTLFPTPQIPALFKKKNNND